MVMPRTNDAVVEAFSPANGIRFIYSDVSGVARSLVAGHGVSPAAAAPFGRMVACTALMQVDFVDDDELLVVSVDVGGRFGGFLLEYDGRGYLRGGPWEKSPETLVASSGTDAGDFFGFGARVKATRVKQPGASIRSQMSMEIPGNRQVSPELIFSELLSSAIPSRVCTSASEWNGIPDRVRALAVQRVPGGSEQAFNRICSLIDDGTAAEQLSSDPTLEAMRDVLGLPDMFSGPTRAIDFGCSCSLPRIIESLGDRSKAEIAGMVRMNRPRTFRCHLCGKTWEIQPEQIVAAYRAAHDEKHHKSAGQ